MFVLNWFWDVLYWIGFSSKEAKILFLGLDNAGKTTLLHMLKDDKIASHVPTLHPHSEELVIGKIKFKTFDLGGHEPARRLWKDYFPTVDAIVFLIDASDRTRFIEAKEELKILLETEELAFTPFLVLGNKIDKPQAVSEEDLRNFLSLPESNIYNVESSKKSGVRPVELFMTSVVKRSGYTGAFKWLSNYLSSA